MITDFVDIEGEKRRCASEFSIGDTVFYITSNKEVYVRDKDGKFVLDLNESKERKILNKYLEEPKHVDIKVEPKKDERIRKRLVLVQKRGYGI